MMGTDLTGPKLTIFTHKQQNYEGFHRPFYECLQVIHILTSFNQVLYQKFVQSKLLATQQTKQENGNQY
uniref:Uncharacterized protein n=1 Tax=Romanomermis culicivorax TaxID=13658 RepID=A0A915K9A6_ROMCU